MPWTEEDVAEHNKAASEDEAKRHQWVSVANHVLSETGDDGRAIRTANAAVADEPEHKEQEPKPSTEKRQRAGMRRPHWRWLK